MPISTAFLEEILNGPFRGAALTAQSSYWLELSESPVAADGSATWLTNATYPGYAPIALDCTPAVWEKVSARKVRTKTTLFFPKADGGNWPKAPVAAGLRRDSAGAATGNADFWGPVLLGRIIDDGDRFKIPAGSLTLEVPSTNLNIGDDLADKILSLLLGTSFDAVSEFSLHFGTQDPKANNGSINELSVSGYAPVSIAANAANFGAANGRKIENLLEIDHTAFWTPAADVPVIRSGELRVGGQKWLASDFESGAKNLIAGDNLRIPPAKLQIKG